MKRLTPKIKFTIALVFTLALAAWPSSPLANPATPQQRETDQQLVWDSFMREGNDVDRYRLADRDVIRIRHEGGSFLDGVDSGLRPRPAAGVPADKVEIIIVSGQNVTWWKGITAFKNAPLRRPGTPHTNWIRLAHIDTQDDDHGPDKMLLNVLDLRDGLQLTFEKAKAFGAHTPMYTFNVPNAQHLGGHRLTFTWERD